MVKLAEMEYTSKRISPHKVLAKGTRKGMNYFVLSYGTHPCGYVEIKENSKFYKKDYLDDELESITCHGGLTYSDFYNLEGANRYLLGWDYAHYNDWTGFHSFGRQWSTDEIIQECKRVIDQLAERE
jgi:hypothetical protein